MINPDIKVRRSKFIYKAVFTKHKFPIIFYILKHIKFTTTYFYIYISFLLDSGECEISAA